MGDVVEVDDSYVTSNFNIPTSFVRHTKKIGDEPDITIDYCVEDEDLVSGHDDTLIYFEYNNCYFYSFIYSNILFLLY